MAFMWANHSHAVSQLQKALGHYFAQFKVSTQSACAYRDLIVGLGLQSRTEPIMLATLNYDLTLDICLQMEGVKSRMFQGSETVVLNKPHGACNIFSESVKASAGVSFGSGIRLSGGQIKIVDNSEASERKRRPQ